MARADDDFEIVLRRCRERLSEISLTLPELDPPGPRRPPSYVLETLTLDRPETLEPVAPPPAPVAPRPAPARPAPPPAPESKTQPAPAPDAPAPAVIKEPPPAVVPVPPAPAAPRVSSAPPPVTEEHEIFPPRDFVERAAPSGPPAGRAPASRAAAGPKTLAAAAALLIAAGFAADRYSRSLDATVSFALDRPVDGLAVRPERHDILVAEGSELLTLSRAGAVLARETLESPVAAMDWDQGSTWVLDGRTAALVERREGQRPTRYELNHVPTALFVKDRSLWTADRRAHALHQYLVSRSILGALLQPLDRIDLPGMDIETFAFDAAGDLWVVDAGRRSLYRLKSSGGVYKPVAAAALSPLVGPSGEMKGLFLEEDGLWLSNNAGGGAVLRRLPASSLDWTPAE